MAEKPIETVPWRSDAEEIERERQADERYEAIAAAEKAVISAAEAWVDAEAAYHGDNWSFRLAAELDARSALRDAVRALRALRQPDAPGKEQS